MSSYAGIYTHLPKQLFRLSTGNTIRIRDRAVKKVGSFDVMTEGGKVLPKALQDPSSYKGPNGASMRPNTAGQQTLVKDYHGNVTIFAVNAGTKVPEDLILIHEKNDHYSLQPAKEMPLADFVAKVNDFFQSPVTEKMTRDDWLKAYPTATETS